VSASLIATVAVAAPLEKSLSYRVPEALRSSVQVGVRVRVPLGRRTAVGYLLALDEGDPDGLKDIAEVLDRDPLFTPELSAFYLRAAAYYLYPPGEAIRTALPSGLSGRDSDITILNESFYHPLEKQGVPSGGRQKEILACIREQGEVALSALRERFPSPYAPLARLCELGFIGEQEREKIRDPFLSAPLPPDTCVDLTGDQQAAVESLVSALASKSFTPFLLHGVTGSGKTEVYLRAIAQAMNLGRRALVLVPEIALTPQLVARFRARFGGGGTTIAVLHSGLSDGERYDAWRAIARGEVQVVIGARSALFAPVPELGVIVVDEEHEASYKQGEGFRYHARDLALMRGQMVGATVVLGSATPAVTTHQRALSGQIGYLRLAGRVTERSLPKVELVDMRGEQGVGALSQPLTEALEANLLRGEQSLILLNRRGFSPYLLCSDCGHTFRCPNCEITLTYHQRPRQLRCHYCDFQVTPPELCPRCQGDHLLPEGTGTERLEEELTALLPQARIARMDRDTMGRKGAHGQLVSQMEAGAVDVLIGTQMVAKGLDFPGVTLVGVIQADSTLNFPDFRSAERTFSLLTQVAGRAGRGERPGRVLIQTYSPEHYALECAARHDYGDFYDQEIVFRQELGYPPFGYLVNLVLAGNDAGKVSASAQNLADALMEQSPDVDVLGPAPCPLARLRGKTRIQILLKSAERPSLRRLLLALPALKKTVVAGVSLAVDVDPMDML